MRRRAGRLRRHHRRGGPHRYPYAPPARNRHHGRARPAVGLTIVPQQHRLFTTVPALAPVAVGLNGSAIYIASALGAAAGGLALALGGTITPTIIAALIGLLAVAVTAFPIPK